MANLFQEALARVSGPTKQEEVASAAEAKKAELSRKTPANDDYVTDPYRDAPERRYNTLEEYRANEGPASTQVIRYFNDRSAQSLRDRAALGKREQQARDEASWADTTEVGSMAGQAKQLGASVATGAARVGSELAGLPFTTEAIDALGHVDDRARAIYSKQLRGDMQREAIAKARTQVMADALTGDLSEAEQEAALARLDEAEQGIETLSEDETAYLDQPGRRFPRDGKPAGWVPPTNREYLERVTSNLETGQGIDEFFNENDFIQGLVNPVNRDALDADLSETWDENKGSLDKAMAAFDAGDTKTGLAEGSRGVAGLIVGGLGDLANNPNAVSEYVAENTPQLALGLGPMGKGLLTASNVGYGMDIYRESVQAFQEENGRLPNQEEAGTMLAVSLSASAAEHVMDASLLSPLRRGKAGELAGDVAERTIRQNLSGAAKRTGSVAGKAVGEGATEAYQTAVEENFSKLNTDVDGEQLFKAGAIGAAVGGPMAAPGEAVDAQRQASARRDQRRQAEDATARNEDEQIADYVRKGDLDGLAQNRDLPADRAAVAIHEVATQENATPEEREKGRKALAKMQTNLDRRIEALEEEGGFVSKERADATREQIRRADAAIAQAKEQGDTETLEALTQFRKERAEVLKSNRNLPAGRRKEIQEELDRLRSARSLSGNNREQMGTESTTVESQKAFVSSATDSTAEASVRKAAADEAVTLLMNGSTALTESDVNQLLQNASDVLSGQQASYLRSLNAAQQARNTASDQDSVHDDIFQGSKDGSFKGLPEYRRNVMAALDAGDMAAAREELTALEAFQASHQRKAELASEANRQAGGTRTPFNIWRDYTADGGWRLAPGKGRSDDGALRKNGGLQIGYGPNYQRVVQALQAEAGAITATADELSQAIALAAQDTPATEQPEAASTSTEATQETADAETTPEADERPQEAEPAEAAPETATESEPEAEASGDELRDVSEDAEPGTATASADPVAAGGTDNRVEATTVYPHITFERVSGGMDPQTFRSPETNLIGAYFSLRKSRDGDASKHPLTTQTDFLSSVLAPATAGGQYSVESLRPYVPELPDLDPATETNPQAEVLGLFAQTAKAWNEALDQIFVAKPVEFRHTDLVQYLVNEQGTLPENVKTAIAGASFTWLQDNLAGPALNTESDVRSILGLSDSDALPVGAMEDLRDAGTRASNVQQDLGRKAFQALGLRLNSDAPVNHQAQLETALGAYAMKLLVKEGFIERREVQSKALGSDNAYQKEMFVRPVREAWSGTFPLKAASQRIVDASRNTQGVIGKLFSVDQLRQEPSFEPVPFTQKTTKGTGEAIPRKQQEIIKGEQSKPWVIRDDMRQVVAALEAVAPERARGLLYRMAGAVDLSTYTVQKARQHSLEGKNQGLQREVDTALGFLDHPEFAEDPAKPFYIPLSVWSNQRVGMNSLINPLESKVHRFLVGKSEWAHQVPLKGNGQGVDKAAKHNLRQFRLAVLEGLGAPVDKQGNDTALKGYDAAVKEVEPHVRAVRALMTGEAVSEQALSDMAEFVAGEEQLHTFDTLVHLARRQIAEMNGEAFFTSTLIREGDGITNGPALATILSGAWSSLADGIRLVNKMGFFEKGNPIQSAGQWQEVLSNNDLYQTLAHRVDEKVRHVVPRESDVRAQQYRSVFTLIGRFTDSKGGVTKAGRNRVKTPLTAMAFGSSVPKAVRAMGEDLVENFYGDIETILNDAGKTDAEKEAAINHLAYHLNHLLGARKLKKLSLAQAQQLELTNEQRQAVITTFTDTVGKQIAETLDEQFNSPLGDNGKPDQNKHSFIQHRQLLNQAAEKTFRMFELARDYETRRFQEELMDAGELAYMTREGSDQHVPLQSLNRKQLKELDTRLKGLNPLVHTAMSKASGHREAGLHMGKAAMQPMIGDPAFRSEVKFQKTEGPNSLKAHGQAMGYSDPGVRVFITNVHAFDSAIASDTYKDFPALNVHDAEIVSANIMQEVAEQMNGATFQNLVDFSLSEEVVKTGYRVYDTFRNRLPEMQEDPAFQKAYQEALEGSLESVDAALAKALKGADIAEKNKLALLSEIETVNQYGVEGGGYKLTEADYQAIADRQKTTVTERVAQDRARTIGETTSSLVAEMSAVQAQPETNQTRRPVKGSPAVAGDPRLLAMLEREPNMPVRKLLSRLSDSKLNKALIRLVPEDMRVRYVTKNTPLQDLPQQDLEGARGYFTVRNGNQELGIMSPDFAESLVTEEVIVHEALHSVLYQVVEDVREGRHTDANARAFVKELEQLRANVVQWLDRPENAALKDTYLGNSNALDNVHELIAWGMTNAGFQRDVLAKVPMATQNRGRLDDGLRRFVTAVARFLFGKTGAVRDNGVGVVLVNVAGLMDQAKRRGEAAREVTLLQRTGPQPEDVQRWSSQEIFDALDDGSLAPADRERLSGVLDSVVTKVQGEQGPWDIQNDAQSPVDRFTVAKATGGLPFSSQATGLFPLTRQQMFVLEQSELALQEAMASDTLAYRELARVFRDARDRLTPKDFLDGDWNQATMDEKTAAQEKYDFLFKLQSIPGEARTNHLSRFAAMVMVSPEIHGKLNAPVSRQTAEGSGLGDRIKGIYDTSMEKLGDRLNQTYSQQSANQRVQALANRLADIQAKHKNTLAQAQVGMADQVDAAAAKLGEAAKRQLGAVADSDLFAGSNNGFMKALGETGSAIAEDRVSEVLDALEEYRAYVTKKRQGLFSSMLNEMRGATEKTMPFHKLLRMGGQNERERKHIQDSVKQDVLSRFTRTLDKQDSGSLTRTVLRTDLSTLAPYFTDEELGQMMEDPRVLDEMIQQWENRVESQGSLGDHYVAYSKLLGYFMATGKARGPNMSLNAYNIARGAGTKFRVSAAQASQAEGAIDALTSLYALRYTSASDRRRAGEIFREENRRGSESGVRYLIKLHEKLKAEALDTLFDGDKALFIKGYTREIYNPYTEIVSETVANGRDLEAQGWHKLPNHLVHDNADPDQRQKFLYVRKWGGLQQHVTGSVSYTGTRRKGSAVHGGQYIPSSQSVHNENVQTTNAIENDHLAQMRQVSRQGKRLNPEAVSSNYMVPVRNTHGDSVNYRYFMTEENKDLILERNNRVEDILGSMASHTFDKASTENQNRQVIESLKAFYDREYTSRPEAFITISPDSDDAQARETYHLLPPKTKELIHQVWGQGGVKVRADMIDMVFGYRKFSAQAMFDKPATHRNTVEAILVNLLSSPYLFGEKAGLRIRQAEDVWQAAVQIVKDNWVIKNLSTLMGNISSNVSILLWSGMSPAKVVETHKTAINGLLEYTRDADELMRLEREQSLGLSASPGKLEQRIAELRDAMDRNPVKGLIDEGLFQTIVEDVDAETDDYSYKSEILKRVDAATESVPGSLKTAGKWMLLTHDTPAYKLLFKSTQMSDFVARYALYQHLTTRKREALDHDSAIQRVADTFVNYDLPTHRTLQYLNDMGAVYFTKYYLRIQKVLLNLMQENPVRGIGLAVMENYFSGLATVMDSSPRLSNPFDAGALNLPESVTEILPIKMLLSLW